MCVLLVFHFIFLLLLPMDILGASIPLAKKGCQSQCGNITLPYPFGIGEGCYGFGKWFEIICKVTSNYPPKPILKSINLELLHAYSDQIYVNSPIIYSNCSGMRNVQNLNLTGSPFIFSYRSNSFTAVGCNNRALMQFGLDIVSGCQNICQENTCFGVNCSCQTTIPMDLTEFNPSFQTLSPDYAGDGCKYAFLVDQHWFSYQKDAYALQGMSYVPAALDWSMINSTLEAQNLMLKMNDSTSSYKCGSTVANKLTCLCNPGFDGSPYIPNGCQDVNECNTPSLNQCPNNCENTYGGYRCIRRSQTKVLIIGLVSAPVLLLLLIGAPLIYKFSKKRRDIKLKRKFFKRLLKQKLSSSDDNVETTIIFNSKELQRATENFSKDRILGHGGQGTVYKGMLGDGKIVAVKKSNIVDEENLEQFINEVVILSQINHRNIVKLLGCCLDTKAPLLVYEFIPNGTLSQYLHDQNEEFQVSWEMRLQIAIEIAAALSYLHSAASVPIFHRDIKSTNILLDEKYRAKIADFGTSRSINIDQTHLTTLVHGTFGYLDPEYFQTSQFTDKSDVYSFGVVLVELLTGQRVISSLRSEEGRSLATYFIIMMKDHRLFEIIDAQVVKQGREEDIMTVAHLALRCLNSNGKNRPTMTQVSMVLEGIRTAQKEFNNGEQNHKEIEYGRTRSQAEERWDMVSTSTKSEFQSDMSLSIDVQSLLPYNTW